VTTRLKKRNESVESVVVLMIGTTGENELDVKV
jgi:hypothetical protein